MTITVSLAEFVDHFDSQSDELRVYLNRRTGEFQPVDSEVEFALDEDEADLSEWRRESLKSARRVLEDAAGDWLQLPTSFDVDMYRIMKGFSATLDDHELGDELYETIGGRGTFRRFKDMLHRHGLSDDWYRYRDEAIRDFSRKWLAANGFECAD